MIPNDSWLPRPRMWARVRAQRVHLRVKTEIAQSMNDLGVRPAIPQRAAARGPDCPNRAICLIRRLGLSGKEAVRVTVRSRLRISVEAHEVRGRVLGRE